MILSCSADSWQRNHNKCLMTTVPPVSRAPVSRSGSRAPLIVASLVDHVSCSLLSPLSAVLSEAMTCDPYPANLQKFCSAGPTPDKSASARHPISIGSTRIVHAVEHCTIHISQTNTYNLSGRASCWQCNSIRACAGCYTPGVTPGNGELLLYFNMRSASTLVVPRHRKSAGVQQLVGSKGTRAQWHHS